MHTDGAGTSSRNAVGGDVRNRRDAAQPTTEVDTITTTEAATTPEFTNTGADAAMTDAGTEPTDETGAGTDVKEEAAAKQTVAGTKDAKTGTGTKDAKADVAMQTGAGSKDVKEEAAAKRMLEGRSCAEPTAKAFKPSEASTLLPATDWEEDSQICGPWCPSL